MFLPVEFLNYGRSSVVQRHYSRHISMIR